MTKCPGRRAAQPAQRHLALESFLELRQGLHFRGKIRRVLDEILRDGIDLHIVRRHFDADGLDVGQLRSASRAVRRRALHAAQRRSTPDQQDLARPTLDHLRSNRNVLFWSLHAAGWAAYAISQYFGALLYEKPLSY